MKRNILLLWSVLLGSIAVATAATDYVANVYGRQITSLNGKWAALIDPYEAGGRIPVYENPKPQRPEQFYEFSFEGGLRLNVPSDWNSQTEELKYYEGTVWYARHFDYRRKTNGREIIYFGGVSNRCTVWLNGKKVTEHEGAFTPFQADVTKLLKEGSNFLCIAVNNTRRNEAIPAMSFDWWNYGGITRDVMLVSVPEVYISDYVIQLDKHLPDVIDVRVELSAAIVGQEVLVEIPELKQRLHLKTDSQGIASTRTKVKKLQRWSPEQPKCYAVTVSAGNDKVRDEIGFRNIEVKGTRIYLNGKETFLRSVSFHEEIPQRMGRAYSEGDAMMLLSEAKALGVNMVRLAHYQQNEYIVRQAERMGIMLWQEIPVWQAIDFSNKETLRKASDMLRETIRRDRNRCADCFWGIANETKNTPERNAFLRELLRVGKDMDTTRLFVAAYDLAAYSAEKDRFVMDDDFYQNLDMIGINKYMGWYAAWPKNPKDLLWDVCKDKPLFISEFGCEALYGQHGDKEVASSWSEEYQAELYRRNLTMFENIENLCGVSPWILYDFRSPTRLHPTNQDGWNRKGLVSDQGQRKQAWYIMHDYYARKAQIPYDKPQPSLETKKGTPLYKDATASVKDRVEDLLARMTLDEKIMQLVQFTLGRNNIENNKGREVVNIPAEVGSLIYFGTDPKLRNTMQRTAMEKSRLGIPVLFAHDVIHGFRTVFPIPLAQACSFNEELAEQSCRVAAQESRMSGVDWTFSPMVDVAHDPRWGRVAEGYGEDPYLNGIMGAAAVRGYQGSSLNDSLSIAACLKHYVAYGASEAGRDYVYTEVSRQTLWDTYLTPYRMCMKEQPATVMSSFNNLSGTPVTSNSYVLQDVLRGKLGFQGFVVSDWAAIQQLKNQGAAGDLKTAGEMALKAGVDMDMMSHAYDEHLKQSLQEGRIDMSVIDTSVRRILTLKFELGLFEKPYTPEPADESRFLRSNSRETAEQLAAESMVLLKNDAALLPLKGKRIAVVGPLRNSQEEMMGCWYGHGEKKDVTTLWDAIVQEFGKENVIGQAQGCDYEGNDTAGFEEAIRLAKQSDVVIACLGERRRWSGENTSRSTIELPQIQIDLLQRLHDTGKKIVLVLSNGRPLQLNRMEPLADAIVEMWQPGTPGGRPLAGILSGRINPSGKLAITFPYTTGQIPIYYNQRPSARHHQGFYQDIPSTPLYTFGYGMSYTSYQYGALSVSKNVLKAHEDFDVTIPVTNTGNMDGKETVLGFVSCKYAKLTRPVKELRFFAKKSIRTGETVNYTFHLNTTRDLAFIDHEGNSVLEPGKYIISIGDQNVELTIEQ